jgi:glycerol-3-phosphate acyltransferase PlsX
LLVETYKLLENNEKINFTGNIEARDIAFGKADVVVADGFTGNVIIKMYEGVAKSITNQIKSVFMKNAFSKLSYLGVKSGMDEFKEKMNYKKYGGAPLVGVQKCVIKAHGSSDAYAFKNAIHQAVKFVDSGFIDIITDSLKEERSK